MNKIALGLFLLAACLGRAAWATDHAEHGASQPSARPSAQEMEKKWKAMLAKPSLAITTAFDDKGRLWRASVQNGYVLVSHSDDSGNSWGQPVKVNAEPEDILGDGENRPKIVVRKGVIYVSYTRGLEKPMTGDIRFSRSLDGGKTFLPPITVNDNREIISHRFDTLAVNDRGQVFLAWLDKRDQFAAQRENKPYKGGATYYAVSDDGGASFKPNLKAVDHSCECCRVAMALDADGVPVIFWRHIYGKNERDHAMLRLDGKSSPIRVSYDRWEVDACPH
ncbi:MAG TPA: sialidase family protein, partial [Sulfuricella sp.]|nr:sialidase family protein [Sulfuricella sp.]